MLLPLAVSLANAGRVKEAVIPSPAFETKDLYQAMRFKYYTVSVVQYVEEE